MEFVSRFRLNGGKPRGDGDGPVAWRDGDCRGHLGGCYVDNSTFEVCCRRERGRARSRCQDANEIRNRKAIQKRGVESTTKASARRQVVIDGRV